MDRCPAGPCAAGVAPRVWAGRSAAALGEQSALVRRLRDGFKARAPAFRPQRSLHVPPPPAPTTTRGRHSRRTAAQPPARVRPMACTAAARRRRRARLWPGHEERGPPPPGPPAATLGPPTGHRRGPSVGAARGGVRHPDARCRRLHTAKRPRKSLSSRAIRSFSISTRRRRSVVGHRAVRALRSGPENVLRRRRSAHLAVALGVPCSLNIHSYR